MKVMNIGIIIRNDHDDTFPVALTTQMVSVIQNLLTQMPALQSKLVDGSGNPVAAKASIPIIPRCMEFDWDTAYAPIMPDEEATLMEALQKKYKKDEVEKKDSHYTPDNSESGGIIVPEGLMKEDDPEDKVKPLFTDKDNPFNMALDASGRANVDLEESADAKETAGAEIPDADVEKAKALKQEDCVVAPEELKLEGKQNPV
jgi:hypothetical protein